MYLKGSMFYLNNITISLGSLIFILYGLVETKKFLQFYKTKFYILFSIHFYAILLNGAHGLIVEHNVINTTLFTEMCLFFIMMLFLSISTFWTYWYYLRFLYSTITGTYFKGFMKIIPFSNLWTRNKDFYDYDTLDMDSRDNYAEMGQPCSTDENVDEIMTISWFRYINYQLVGNYLFTQLFNLYVLTISYFVRMITIATEIYPINQIIILNICMLLLLIISGYFDYRYRRFTKAFILPHLTALVLSGGWMFEFYSQVYITNPEPISTMAFVITLMYIVIKFTFLTDSLAMEKLKQRKVQ